jgi:ABC-type dipeptide/oligopeptide/nickel transport system permease component
LLRRIALIPVVLIAVYHFGYAYALIAQRTNLAENPFAAQEVAPPILQTTLNQLSNLLRLNFGQLAQARGEVAGFVLAALGNSLFLLLMAFAVSVVFGLLLGFAAVKWNPAGLRGWLLPASVISLSLPSFYLGILLIAAVLRMPGAPLAVQGFGLEPRYWLLPVIALSLRPLFQVARFTASLMSEEAGKQYVVTARSVGNTWPAIRRKHVWRNVIAPAILNIAASFRLIVAELVVVEWLFNWPGIGRVLAMALVPPSTTAPDTGLSAVLYLNPEVVALSFAVLAALFMLADAIATTAAQRSDPRLLSPAAEAGAKEQPA